jgi:PKD repeat protein
LTQIRATGLTLFAYAGIQPGRLIGTPQAGEADLRSVFTSANTSQIYAVGASVNTFSPTNPFSPLKVLTPGVIYAVKGKASFTVGLGFPNHEPIANSRMLAATQNVATPGLPQADFNFTVNGGTVSFTPTGLNAGNSGSFVNGYDWDFGDGSPLDLSNSPSHTYTAIGSYVVKLRVVTDTGVRGPWVAKSVTVTVAGSSPSPSPSPSPGGGAIPVGSVGTPPSGWVLRSAVPNGATIKEIWFGNSVSDERLDLRADAGVDALSQIGGYNFLWARIMTPGAPLPYLRDVDAAFTTAPFGLWRNALGNYAWDWITFQPFQRPPDEDLGAIQAFLDVAIPVSGPNLQIWMYQRWPSKRSNGVNDAAYYSQVWETEWIREQYTYHSRDFFNRLYSLLRAEETRSKPVLTICVGEVMAQFNSLAAAGEIPNHQDIWSLYSDDIHLTDTGSYLVALTHYASFYFKSPVGMAIPSGYGAIDPGLARDIQEIVWQTVSTHPQTAYRPPA